MLPISIPTIYHAHGYEHFVEYSKVKPNKM